MGANELLSKLCLTFAGIGERAAGKADAMLSSWAAKLK
jgi:hypothetical protein